MAIVVDFSKYAPDNSGSWVDDGWGGWTQDPSIVSKVPVGYYDIGWKNLLLPTEANPTLDPKTVKNVLKTVDQAKDFEDTAVGKILSGILSYGTSFVNLLSKTGIIKDSSSPISYANIDSDKAKASLENGTLQHTRYVVPPKSDKPAVNSTFFGLDFSNPIVIILVIAGLFGLWKLVNGGTPALANVSPSVSNSPSLTTIPRPKQRYISV